VSTCSRGGSLRWLPGWPAGAPEGTQLVTKTAKETRPTRQKGEGTRISYPAISHSWMFHVMRPVV